jgi:hypothetical protein
MSYFTGSRRNTQEGARDAIVGLRRQLLMLEKKEEHLNKKIEEEMKKARANASTNKRCKLGNPVGACQTVLVWHACAHICATS